IALNACKSRARLFVDNLDAAAETVNRATQPLLLQVLAIELLNILSIVISNGYINCGSMRHNGTSS
ncbi:MAG: hypothetical protein AB4050_02790, partial [Synechococcus sp.]